MSNVNGVYLHCKPNGEPFYVGKGTIKRSNDLISSRNRHHQNIVNKYGKNNILVRFMECVDEKSALKLEVELISVFRKSGFVMANISSGGDVGNKFKWSDESRKKLSETKKGMSLSAEHRKAIGLAHKGKKKRPMSDEHKLRLGCIAKGKRWYNNGENVVFCHEGNQPEGYILGRKNPKFTKVTTWQM